MAKPAFFSRSVKCMPGHAIVYFLYFFFCIFGKSFQIQHSFSLHLKPTAKVYWSIFKGRKVVEKNQCFYILINVDLAKHRFQGIKLILPQNSLYLGSRIFAKLMTHGLSRKISSSKALKKVEINTIQQLECCSNFFLPLTSSHEFPRVS